jgi:hypothetical protein
MVRIPLSTKFFIVAPSAVKDTVSVSQSEVSILTFSLELEHSTVPSIRGTDHRRSQVYHRNGQCSVFETSFPIGVGITRCITLGTLGREIATRSTAQANCYRLCTSRPKYRRLENNNNCTDNRRTALPTTQSTTSMLSGW